MTERRFLSPSDARAVLERHGGLFDSSPLQRASAFAVPLALVALLGKGDRVPVSYGVARHTVTKLMVTAPRVKQE